MRRSLNCHGDGDFLFGAKVGAAGGFLHERIVADSWVQWRGFVAGVRLAKMAPLLLLNWLPVPKVKDVNLDDGGSYLPPS